MRDTKRIRVFLEVARHSSFSAAAKSLGMTAATVTRVVARLEQEFGQQLFVRTTRQVALTSIGALIAARYRPVLEAYDQVEADLAAMIQPHRGRLSINAPVSFGLRLMPGLVDSFRLAYPHIDLSIRLTDRLVDIVAETCDLAIRISAPPTDKSTIWRKLCEVPIRAVAAPSLFDRHPRPTHPDDLDPAICLSYGAGDGPEHWHFTKQGVRRSVVAGTALQTNNGDLLFEVSKQGGGIVVLPEFLVAAGLARGDVEEVLPDWALPPLWLSLFYPPYETLPPLVGTFTDFFESYLADVDGFTV